MRQRRDRKEEKQGKTYRRKAAAGVFAGLLLLLCLVDLVPGEKAFSEVENRALETRPKVTLKGIISGDFMRQYEESRVDQFVIRSFWVSLKARVELLAGKRESNGVFKGKDGYLLEDIAKPDEEQMEKNLEAIRVFSEDYPKIPMYMMLVPNAADILGDKLPQFAETENQSQIFESVQQSLERSVTWIDAGKVMKEHKKEDIYYHTDSRWTTLGAYYAYQQLAESLQLDPEKSLEFQKYAVTNIFNGDLSSASGYEMGYEEPLYIYVPEENAGELQIVVDYVEEGERTATLYDRESLLKKDKYKVFMGGDHALVDIRTTADTTDRLLVIKDSYANCLIPFLIPYYREIIVVDPVYYQGDLDEVMESKISKVLFLYSGNSFVKDQNISGVLQDDKTE